MSHWYRMAKDHRTYLLVPFSICIVFILCQCILQKESVNSPKWSIAFLNNDKRRWSNEEAGSLRNERRNLWNRVSEGWVGDRDETSTAYFPADAVRRGVGDELNYEMDMRDEEFERLSQSPYIYHEKEEIERQRSQVIQKEMKYISYYQPYDITDKSFKVCRYNMCSYAKNMSQADVIAFKAALIRDHGLPSFHRPKHQRWVLFTSDPASKDYNLDSPEMRSKFNATCTYRLDSDIKWTFGKLRKIQPPSYLDYDTIYDGKRGLVAWFVSHCQTWGGREEFVRRMQKVIKVDVYGLCSNLTCGDYNHRKDDRTACLPMLSAKYKFYLSFENTFCEDYVTEKFFKLFKNVHVIPVVRGGVDYSKLFPSGVYINTADFDSPEELANYLADLGNDKETYLQMLRKKSSWVFTPGGEMKHCKLCEYAHTVQAPKYYPNIKDVFNGDHPHCWRPTDIEE